MLFNHMEAFLLSCVKHAVYGACDLGERLLTVNTGVCFEVTVRWGNVIPGVCKREVTTIIQRSTCCGKQFILSCTGLKTHMGQCLIISVRNDTWGKFSETKEETGQLKYKR